MPDTFITITTANWPDGRTATAIVGAPASQNYTATINNNSAVITIPEADLANAASVDVNVTVETASGTPASWPQITIEPDPNATSNGTLIDCDVWKSSLRVTDSGGTEIYPNGVGELTCGQLNITQTWQAVGGGAVVVGAESIIPLRLEYGGNTITATFVSQANGTDNTYSMTVPAYDDTLINSGTFHGGVTGDPADACSQVIAMGDCVAAPAVGGFPTPTDSTWHPTPGVTGLPAVGAVQDTVIPETQFRNLGSGRHQYSQRMFWSINGDYCIQGTQVKTYPSLAVVGDLNAHMSGELNWSYTDNNVVYGTSDNNIIKYNVSAGTSSTVATVGEWAGTFMSLGRFQGAQSIDDVHFPVCQLDGSLNAVVMTVVRIDPGNGNVTYPTPISANGLDWFSVSALGNYIMGKFGSTGFVYDYATGGFTNYRAMPNSITHGDLGQNIAGEEVYVDMAEGDNIRIFRLSDMATAEKSLQINGSGGHFSFAKGRVGYGIITQHTNQAIYSSRGRADRTSVASSLRIDMNSVLNAEQFGHTKAVNYDQQLANTNESYWGQGKGSASFLGDKVAFGSSDFGPVFVATGALELKNTTTPPPPPTTTARVQSLLDQRSGFGRNTTGGAAGTMTKITSLTDGSLLSALTDSVARWIYFDSALDGQTWTAPQNAYPGGASGDIFIQADKTLDGRDASVTLQLGIPDNVNAIPWTVADNWTYRPCNMILQEGNVIVYGVTIKGDLLGTMAENDGPIDATFNGTSDFEIQGGANYWISKCNFENISDEALSVFQLGANAGSLTGVTMDHIRFIDNKNDSIIGRDGGTTFPEVTQSFNWSTGAMQGRAPGYYWSAHAHVYNCAAQDYNRQGIQVLNGGEVRSENNYLDPGCRTNSHATRTTNYITSISNIVPKLNDQGSIAISQSATAGCFVTQDGSFSHDVNDMFSIPYSYSPIPAANLITYLAANCGADNVDRTLTFDIT